MEVNQKMQEQLSHLISFLFKFEYYCQLLPSSCTFFNLNTDFSIYHVTITKLR